MNETIKGSIFTFRSTVFIIISKSITGKDLYFFHLLDLSLSSLSLTSDLYTYHCKARLPLRVRGLTHESKEN